MSSMRVSGRKDSPITEKYFKMSHHKGQEVAKGTLKSISNDSGVKL